MATLEEHPTLTENHKSLPTAFLGSSSESRDIAEAILENLEGKVEITSWHHDFFEPTSSVLDDLVAKMGNFDFGVFIFAPDDLVQIRHKATRSVRNNVLFELGLFVGKLGMQRVFIVASGDSHEMHIPSDLLGRNLVTFSNRQDGNLVASLETACRKLYDAMKRTGPKLERLRELELAQEQMKFGQPSIMDLPEANNIIAEKQIGRGSIVVVNDDIRNANTEIIVSSDDKHFTARGGVSKAILAKGGPEVRRQLEYYGKLQFRQGQVVVTTGGDWNRRAFIHAAVIDLDENRYPSSDIIQLITRRILDCAVALGARSIALPVLGGGYATRFLKASDSVNAIASEILAFMGSRNQLDDVLKRVALYIMDRDAAAGLPKELVAEADSTP